jgi:hypothetical protein
MTSSFLPPTQEQQTPLALGTIKSNLQAARQVIDGCDGAAYRHVTKDAQLGLHRPVEGRTAERHQDREADLLGVAGALQVRDGQEVIPVVRVDAAANAAGFALINV